MTAETVIESTVQKGWRRRLLVLTVDQSAIALALIFGAFALLILLGTQILAWPWLLGIAVIGIGISVWGICRRLTDSYTVAQMIDCHLALKDSLSTAWFLRHQAIARESETAAQFQLRHAESVAHAADLSAAFPFERRRAWFATAALFLLALGLFSTRYLVTHDLSLEHSFLPLTLTQVFEYARHADAARPGDTAASRTAPLPPGAIPPDAEHQAKSPGAEKQDGNQPPAQSSGRADSKGDQASDQNVEQSKAGKTEGGDSKHNGANEGSKSGANPQNGGESAKDSGKQDANQQQNSGEQKPNSLMDRMRDAMSSVMAKIKPAGSPKESQSGQQKGADGQKSSEQAGSKDQSSDGQKDGAKEQSAQEQASGQQQGQGAAKAQSSGKDSAQASDKKGSDAQSGVGHSDGDKDVKAAEQAKAMGKLAEIIGKRSASLTGEMQVEPSGKQHLQTDYTKQQAQHTDSGGEINRDEVPVEDQEYVREYMELVRKQSAKAAAASAVRKKPAPGTTSY